MTKERTSKQKKNDNQEIKKNNNKEGKRSTR